MLEKSNLLPSNSFENNTIKKARSIIIEDIVVDNLLLVVEQKCQWIKVLHVEESNVFQDRWFVDLENRSKMQYSLDWFQQQLCLNQTIKMKRNIESSLERKQNLSLDCMSMRQVLRCLHNLILDLILAGDYLKSQDQSCGSSFHQ